MRVAQRQRCQRREQILGSDVEVVVRHRPDVGVDSLNPASSIDGDRSMVDFNQFAAERAGVRERQLTEIGAVERVDVVVPVVATEGAARSSYLRTSFTRTQLELSFHRPLPRMSHAAPTRGANVIHPKEMGLAILSRPPPP